MVTIKAIAETILRREQFNNYLTNGEFNSTDWSGESNSNNETSTEDDIRQTNTKKSKFRKWSGALKKKKAKKVSYDSNDEIIPIKAGANAKASVSANEMEGLIDMMNRMDITFSKYAQVYYQAIKLDHNIVNVVWALDLQSKPMTLLIQTSSQSSFQH